MVKRIIAVNCAHHTGQYAVGGNSDSSNSNRIEGLRQIDQMQRENIELRIKLRKEKNLGDQIQLNTRVKQLACRIEKIIEEL